MAIWLLSSGLPLLIAAVSFLHSLQLALGAVITAAMNVGGTGNFLTAILFANFSANVCDGNLNKNIAVFQTIVNFKKSSNYQNDILGRLTIAT
jgi:hypothetical protein